MPVPGPAGRTESSQEAYPSRHGRPERQPPARKAKADRTETKDRKGARRVPGPLPPNPRSGNGPTPAYNGLRPRIPVGNSPPPTDRNRPLPPFFPRTAPQAPNGLQDPPRRGKRETCGERPWPWFYHRDH